MHILNKNLRFLRENAGWTQKELAKRLDVNHPVIGSYEEGRSIPPMKTVLKIADLFKVNLDVIVREEMSKDPIKFLNAKFVRGGNVLSITVDHHNNENIELVHQKAAAGYLTGYSDPEYIRDLPKISLPGFSRSDTFRAFEIAGDSMLPVKQGDVVVGRYISNINEIQNGKTYVLVSQFDGVAYKRIYNFSDSSKLLLVSDNRSYNPYTIDIQEVMEIWSFVARVCFQEEDFHNPPSKTLDFIASKWFEYIQTARR